MGSPRGRVAVVAVALLAVGLAGCTQPGGAGRNISSAKVDELESKIQDLQSQIDSLKQDNQDLQKQVNRLKQELPPKTGLNVHVKQEPGVAAGTYWVLPGPRQLSPTVFGLGEDQKRRHTGAWQLDQLRAAGQGKLAHIIETRLPFLVGVPQDADVVEKNGSFYWQTATPFSDRARIVNGSLDIVYKDRQPYDGSGPPIKSKDRARVNVSFTDPAGNTYEIVYKTPFQPPIPGYQTAGGTMVNAWHHGVSLTGAPVMPRVYTYGAFWALGDLKVNGEIVEKNHVVHFMTTQNVRKANYELAIDEELPLKPSNTAGNQRHHTHGFFMPLQLNMTPQGPKPSFDPVNTSFVLPNNKTQPFIHIMYEEDTIVDGPFGEAEAADGDGGNGTAQADLTIEGTEWEFRPSQIEVTEGETVTIAYRNLESSNAGHNIYFNLDGDSQAEVKSATIGPGETTTVTFTPEQTGTFAYWCDVPGHREQGLEGTVTVTAA